MRTAKVVLRHSVPAALLLLAVACGGGNKDKGTTPTDGDGDGAGTDGSGAGGAAEVKLPAIPSSPAPMPDAVLATVSIGDPQGQLASMAEYANAVQPGFGAMVAPAQLVSGVAAVVGAPGLDGVDLTKPLYLLLLDPQKGGGQALLIVGVADKNRMAGSVGGEAVLQVHEGFAAIGSGAAVVAASPYGLSNLAKTAPAKHPHGVIYMNRIMDAYGGQLDAQLRQSMGSNPTPAELKTAEGMVKALGAVERIEADLEASATTATASFAMFPEQGSVLAQWGQLQKPSDYGVAARLPAGPWLMLGAGRVDWGPFKTFWADVAAAQGKPEMADWFGVFGPEIALGMFVKDGEETLRVAGLVAVTDPVKLAKLVKDYVVQMAAKPTPMDGMQVTAKANAYKTNGVSLHEMTIKPTTPADPKKPFSLKSYFGLASNWMVFTLDQAKSAKQLAAKTVSNARAKSPPKSSLSKTFEKAVADSKAKNESGLMVFDLSVMAPDPAQAKGAEVTLGFGFDGPVMRSRVTVPPATMKFVVEQQMRKSGMGP